MIIIDEDWDSLNSASSLYFDTKGNRIKRQNNLEEKEDNPTIRIFDPRLGTFPKKKKTKKKSISLVL